MLALIVCSITKRPIPRKFLAKSYDYMCSSKLALQLASISHLFNELVRPTSQPLVCALLQPISLSFSLSVLFLMEHLHPIASTTQLNLAVESRQMREEPENKKKTLGPEGINADYFLLQPAVKIPVLLRSTPFIA